MDDFQASADWDNSNEHHDYYIAARATQQEAEKYLLSRPSADKVKTDRRYFADVRSNEGQVTASVSERSDPALFKTLLRSWNEKTKFFSAPHDIVLDPDYQRIIGMGKRALPLIIRELERDGGYWFWALRAITGEDPVPAGARGNFAAMRDAWLGWAAEKKLT